jgi:glycosyltransferase involved in cell wall biosynthesis
MVEIVIPTYKRLERLALLLNSITRQTLLPKKVIIVYAGISEDSIRQLANTFTLNIALIQSEPSVCKQRNKGIEKVNSKDYLIATGEEHRLDPFGNWNPIIDSPSHKQLWFNAIFGLTIWSDLTQDYYKKNSLSRWITSKLLLKGNHISKGGWPMVSAFNTPVMESTIYGLGCSMIRSSHLKKNLFNKNMPQHGIGENYELALKINGLSKKIAVLRTLNFKHYKAATNRVSNQQAYVDRVSELKRVVFNLKYFRLKNRFYFLWSLLGNSTYFLWSRKWGLFSKNNKVILQAFVSLKLFKK